MNTYFAASLILLYASLMITSLEYLKARSIFAGEGMLSWKTLRLRQRVFDMKPFGQFFGIVYDRKPIVLFIAILLLSAAGIVIVVLFNRYALLPVFIVQVVVLNLVILLFNYRSRYALDGADQLNTISITCLSICLLGSAQNYEQYFMLFIAFQLTLAYFIAGVFKIFSRKWLSGSAVKDIFTAQVYGNTFVANSFKRFPRLPILLSIVIIAWESLFPFSFFLPETFFFGFLFIGLLFHLFNAVFMGLNCFFISFIAGYPALIYCYYLVRQLLAG